MKKLVETVLENLSTKEMFLFRMTCGNCGMEYGNKPIRFSKAEIPPTTQSKQIIFNALYEQELIGDLEAALNEEQLQMFLQPQIASNGKLIGAVTHVLINDPAKGYGIFIENMLEN